MKYETPDIFNVKHLLSQWIQDPSMRWLMGASHSALPWPACCSLSRSLPFSISLSLPLSTHPTPTPSLSLSLSLALSSAARAELCRGVSRRLTVSRLAGGLRNGASVYVWPEWPGQPVMSIQRAGPASASSGTNHTHGTGAGAFMVSLNAPPLFLRRTQTSTGMPSEKPKLKSIHTLSTYELNLHRRFVFCVTQDSFAKVTNKPCLS